jgi:anti-anti-sigma factor
MQNQNEITFENRDAITIISINGDLTVLSEAALKEAYDSANDRGVSKILLDFDPGAYINSGGIALIIQLLGEARKRSQMVGITGLSEHFKKVFSMVGVTKYAKVYASVDEAVAEM